MKSIVCVDYCAAPLSCTWDIRYPAPRCKGPSAEQAIMRRSHQMPTDTKKIVDGTVHREKALGLPRGFESAHRLFLLPGRLMRDFRAIVLPGVVSEFAPSRRELL